MKRTITILTALVLSAAALVLPASTFAQSSRPVVAILFPASEQVSQPYKSAFVARLAELGYVEGRDYALAVRNVNTIPNRDAGLRLGGELLALSPAVLVMGAPRDMMLAVHELTTSVPVVLVNLVGDPVAFGIADSFSHPGRNMTGFMLATTEAIIGKQLSILSDLSPSIRRVEEVFDAAATPPAFSPEPAQSGSISVRSLPVKNLEDLKAVIADAKDKSDALIFDGSPMFNSLRNQIVEMVAQAGLVALYRDRELPIAGGLVSYGASVRANYAASARYAAKILGGIKVGDLPFQQPDTYDLVINLNTAKALGISVPTPLLARANDVVE